MKVKTTRYTLCATRYSLLTAYCLMLTACLLLASCGKKGPPTLKSYEKPDAPSGLNAIHREDKIILLWSYGKKENLKDFDILKSDGVGFQKIASVGKDESSYTDTDFKTDVLYKYKVVARSLKNVFSNDSNVITIKPGPVPPAPENISFGIGNDSLRISWEGAGEGISYNIYKSHEKGKYSINPINNAPLKATSYTDNLELNRPVYYTVRGVLNNESRDEGPASDEIEVNPVNFMPSRPGGLQAVVADDKVVIMWNENPESWVMKYRIYRKISEREEFKLIGESVTPAFTDREKTGTRHTYRVTALGSSKESEPSEIVAVYF